MEYDQIPTLTVWETCLGCKREFAYPHLCRAHNLCGICHSVLPQHDEPEWISNAEEAQVQIDRQMREDL